MVSSNVSGHVNRFYQCKHVKAVCSSNVSKQNACNVSSVSKLVKPLTVIKSNICNASIFSQNVKPLHVRKSTSSCYVRSLNVHIRNSISHHTKPLSVGKSDCSCDVSKRVVRESVVVNISKRARRRYFHVSSHKHGVILMTSIHFYELVIL